MDDGLQPRASCECAEKWTRLLFECGSVCVHRVTPFLIWLVDRVVANCALQLLRAKLDPGSLAMGMALE